VPGVISFDQCKSNEQSSNALIFNKPFFVSSLVCLDLNRSKIRIMKREIGEFDRHARLPIAKKENVFRGNIEMSNTFLM
jgi:hypothetical protein